MANTAFSPTNSVTTTSAANFIPEIWSDEIVAAYKKNLVLANLVKKMSFKGKKGDTVNIPSPARGSASAKAATDAVTLIAESDTNIQVLINKHYEYSRLIEDIVEVQALTSLRSFYTEDAGYALAKRIDTDLVQLGRAFNGATVGTDDYATSNTTTKAYIGSDGTTAYNSTSSNAAALTDAAIRRTIQRLDDNDIPMDGSTHYFTWDFIEADDFASFHCGAIVKSSYLEFIGFIDIVSCLPSIFKDFVFYFNPISNP